MAWELVAKFNPDFDYSQYPDEAEFHPGQGPMLEGSGYIVKGTMFGHQISRDGLPDKKFINTTMRLVYHMKNGYHPISPGWWLTVDYIDPFICKPLNMVDAKKPIEFEIRNGFSRARNVGDSAWATHSWGAEMLFLGREKVRLHLPLLKIYYGISDIVQGLVEVYIATTGPSPAKFWTAFINSVEDL